MPLLLPLLVDYVYEDGAWSSALVHRFAIAIMRASQNNLMARLSTVLANVGVPDFPTPRS